MEMVGTEKGETQKAEGELSGKRQLTYFKLSGKLIYSSFLSWKTNLDYWMVKNNSFLWKLDAYMVYWFYNLKPDSYWS